MIYSCISHVRFAPSPAETVLLRVLLALIIESCGWQMINPSWGSPVWPESHLTYMIDIALTTEFSLAASGAR